jgi:hypothetical protein
MLSWVNNYPQVSWAVLVNPERHRLRPKSNRPNKRIYTPLASMRSVLAKGVSPFWTVGKPPLRSRAKREGLLLGNVMSIAPIDKRYILSSRRESVSPHHYL